MQNLYGILLHCVWAMCSVWCINKYELIWEPVCVEAQSPLCQKYIVCVQKSACYFTSILKPLKICLPFYHCCNQCKDVYLYLHNGQSIVCSSFFSDRVCAQNQFGSLKLLAMKVRIVGMSFQSAL